MFNRQAKNSILENGFQSKPQVRYLLRLMRLYPDQYSWVKDALKDHGMPERDEPLHTYWDEPYNVSPDTPSYRYTGRRKSELKTLIKLANKLDAQGKEEKARILDLFISKKIQANAKQLAPFVIDEKSAKEVANQYWSVRGNEIVKDSSSVDLVKFFDKFEEFKPYNLLSPLSQQEAHRFLGDLLKDKLRLIGYRR